MRATARGTLAVALAVVGAWTCMRTARASNAATPRTPPVFKHEACLTIVDRSVDPIFHLDFAIPFEDAILTQDELPDSRRFQFFAVCRDHPFGEVLPNWAFMDDAERSLAAGLIEVLPEAADVLELAPAWSAGHDDRSGSCVAAMNAADERIPITCEATEGGLEWDTSDVPPGNYVVHGHTFEPELNTWESRRGVVQVVDAEDERIPVVSIMFPAREGTRAYEEDGYRVVGCMDGPPGTHVTLSWATASDLAPGSGEEVWTPFAELDAEDGEFDLPFEIPAEAVQQAVIFRGVARDPEGREWVGHAPHPLIVYPGEGTSDPPFKPPGPDYCGFYPDDEGDTTGGAEPDPATGDEGAGSGSSTGVDGSTNAGPGGTAGDADGCSCRSARNGSDASLHGLWLLALTAVRRRR
jgi:hypothetical protein